MAERSIDSFDVPSASKFLKIKSKKKEVLYVLKNKNGLKATITNCGGRLISLLVPDNKGRLTNVVAGAETGKDFQQTFKTYPGTTIKYIDNDYVFGGIGHANNSTLELICFSNELGGALKGGQEVKVVYTLTDDNRLKISYETSVNYFKMIYPGNNIYFNLNGAESGNTLNHIVQINADSYMTIDDVLAPKTETDKVSGTPFDFRKATTIGARINDNNEQLKKSKGYDHFFILNKHSNRTPVARIKGDKSGIILEICTAEPGLHFFAGNPMFSKNSKKEGQVDSRTGFSLTPKYFIGLGGRMQFPVAALSPDRICKTTVVYRFHG